MMIEDKEKQLDKVNGATIELIRKINDALCEFSVSVVAPHSLDAEKAVLAYVFLDNGNWQIVKGSLGEADFFEATNRHIFSLMCILSAKKIPIDVITMMDFIKENELDSVDQVYLNQVFLTELHATLEAYVNVMLERSDQRKTLGCWH